MFGGNTNPAFLGPMDNVRMPYNTNAVPAMQFVDVLGGSNGGIMNMMGNNNASLNHLAMKLSTGVPVLSQHKFPLIDGIGQDDGAQGRSMWKQIPVSTGLKLSYGEEEHNSSISSAGESTMINRSTSQSRHDNLQTEFVRQTDELDHYIRMQEENMRKGIAELNHRHTMSLLSALEKEVECRMREKDAEIEDLNQKNKELADKVRQLVIEAQSWHDRAKQGEFLVNALRSNINQILLQGAACVKEGFGENMVDDAVSSCSQPHPNQMTNVQLPSAVSTREPVTCRACKGSEVSVLLLPCRHMCLCTDCETFIEICPVCQVKKDGSLQVYMS